MQNRAQGSLEYLLIIGAAILIVSISVVGLTLLTGSGKETVNAGSIQESQNIIWQQHALEKGQYYIPLESSQYYTYIGLTTTIGDLEKISKEVSFCRKEICDDSTRVNPGETITATTGKYQGAVNKNLFIPTEALPPQTVQETVVGGKTAYSPLINSSGAEIINKTQLLEAYSDGDITLYENENEISITAREDTRRGTFKTVSSWCGPPEYIDVTRETCQNPSSGLPIMSPQILKIRTAPNRTDLVGKTFYVESSGYGILGNCDYGCWNSQNPCGQINGFNIGGSCYGPSYTINGWDWDVYNYDLIYGNTPTGPLQVGIDPTTGTITGLSGNITISYYHK
jgi:hypothetical protein